MISNLLIALPLSADAFAIAVMLGLVDEGAKIKNALTVGAYFGSFQALMPAIGYLLASSMREYIDQFGHIVSFFVLAYIGAKMTADAIKDEGTGGDFGGLSSRKLLFFAVATSIDALAAGVGVAFINVNLSRLCVIVGAVTFMVCFSGYMLGKSLPVKSGKRAGTAGGLILVALSVKILIEGLVS